MSVTNFLHSRCSLTVRVHSVCQRIVEVTGTLNNISSARSLQVRSTRRLSDDVEDVCQVSLGVENRVQDLQALVRN